MINNKVEKDERAIDIEKTSYSLGYKVMAFAILIDVMYRSLKIGEASWDLLGIVILGGLVSTVYQIRRKVWTRSWVRATILVFTVAAVVAVIIILTRIFCSQSLF